MLKWFIYPNEIVKSRIFGLVSKDKFEWSVKRNTYISCLQQNGRGYFSERKLNIKARFEKSLNSSNPSRCQEMCQPKVSQREAANLYTINTDQY